VKLVLLDIVLSAVILIGGFFTLLGSIGLARLPDVFSRMHGPVKATTLGVGSIVIASLLHFQADEPGFGARELAITLFLFITAPVSAHLLSKAALREQELQRKAKAEAEATAAKAEAEKSK
jgi:multicomponent K+:H+ antiporter subunit G